MEAAASGRPLVATDVPGCREIVRHGHNGFLVPVRDQTALALAIRRLVEDGELRAKMGACSRQRAVSEFSLERVIRETVDVYRSIAPGRFAASMWSPQDKTSGEEEPEIVGRV
jgi:glycosyltransferase involved in cell wall biosynthesis